MSIRRVSALASVIGFVLVACLSIPLSAQTTGTILGVVSDPSGAAVIGAPVEAQDLGTGLVQNAVTTVEGAYLIPSLPPGIYKLTVSASGFKTFAQSGITVQVGQNSRVDVRLEIGQLTETVTVEGEAIVVDTQSTTVGATMDRRRLQDLPLNGRNILELAQLLPGVGTGEIETTNPNARTGPVITVSGSRAAANNIMLDGTSMVEAQYNRGVNFPNPDAIEEFRVLTNTYSAEYGRGTGGIFLGVTKSGTNQVHGSAFEFLRNDALNARNFFSEGIPKLVQNQFGGSLGGPLVADRTFLFGSFQGIRIRQDASLNTFFPPTEAERRGDFSARSNAINDPDTRQPFPNNIIPSGRIDPAAVAFIDEYVPLPNRPNGSNVPFRSLPTDGNQAIIKGDHIFSSADRIAIRWFRNKDEVRNQGGNDSFRLAGEQGTTVHTGVVNHTHVFGPGLLNEAGVSFLRIANNRDPSPLNKAPRDFGINTNLDGTLPLAPRFFVSGRFTSAPQPYSREPEQTWQFTDQLSWVRGRHSMKMGFAIRNVSHRNVSDIRTGNFEFNGAFSNYSMADLMLGRPNLYFQGNPNFTVSESEHYHAYIQEDIKLSRQLTVNLGLRYEVSTPFVQANGRGTTVIPGRQSVLFPKAPIGLVVPGDPGVPSGIIHADKNNFLPRVGFAWDPTGSGRTAIRGAYGIFIASSPALDSGKGVGGLPWRLALELRPPPSLRDPFAGVENPFPFVFSRDIDFPPLPIAGNSLDPTYRDGYIQQFNLNVQHQFGNDWIVQVGYVGSAGRKLSASRNINWARFGPGATAGNIQQRRPLPAFTGVNNTSSDTSSLYNSLQASLNKRFARRYTLQLAYTFSKSVDERSGSTTDDGTGVNDQVNFKEGERGLSDFHQKHILAINGIWDIPSPERKNPLTALIRDWQLAGKYRLASGLPFSVTSGRDIALSGTGAQRPNAVGDAPLDSSRSTGDRVARYFEIGAFSLPGAGLFGNSGRNSLVGPGFVQTDLAISRRFPLGERFGRLEFRGEIFNLFNNTNFGNPNSNFSSPGFGRLQGAEDARIVQFALRYDF